MSTTNINNYTEIAQYYDQIVGGGYYDMPKFASEYKSLIGQKAKKILEIGVGTGGLTLLLKDDYKVVGVDFSEALLAIAKEKLRGTDVDLIHADVRTMKFNEEFDAAVGHGSIFIIIDSKDGIVSESFLTNTNDVKIALKNICNSIKKDGILIWDFHAEHAPGKRFVSLPGGNKYEFEIKQINGMKEFYKLQQIKDSSCKLIAQSTDHKIRIPLAEFESLAISAGFAKCEIKTLGGKYLVLTK